MLAIGRALMAQPTVLLLDEPSLGLAPLLVKQIFEIVRAINAQGTTVVLVEQNAHQALRVAHRAYVLETGALALEGPAQELANDPRVRAAYLGEGNGGRIGAWPDPLRSLLVSSLPRASRRRSRSRRRCRIWCPRSPTSTSTTARACRRATSPKAAPRRRRASICCGSRSPRATTDPAISRSAIRAVPNCATNPGESAAIASFICSPAGGHNHPHYQNFLRYELLDAHGAAGRARGEAQLLSARERLSRRRREPAHVLEPGLAPGLLGHLSGVSRLSVRRDHRACRSGTTRCA